MVENNLENMWFQKDGATCYTTHANMAYGDINWPPRSCDLTPLDFFYVKDRIYADKPSTLEVEVI